MIKNKSIIYILSIITTLTLLPNIAYANSVSIATMFESSSNTWVAFMNLSRGLAFLLGIIVTSMALFKFKEVSEGGGRTTVKTPLIWTAVGAAFVSFGATLSVGTETLSLGTSNGASLLSQNHTETGNAHVEAAIRGILIFIKLVGHVAFIRGLLLLKEYGQGKEGTVGRAITHILGGAACINIEPFVGMLAATFYPGMSFTGFS